MNGKVSNLMEVAYVRRYTLTEGKENGLKVIEVNNGVLRFLLNESKALDMMQLWHKGTNISFISKNGFTAREIPFLNRFEGGMIYTCGLDSVGVREGFEFHGSLHHIPAKVISTRCDEKEICVVAEMEDGELFGKNLLLRRTVKTAIGSDVVTVEDSLVNCSYCDEKYALMYHINLGYPMLDAGVKTELDVDEIIPRSDWARERIDDFYCFTDAVDNEFERTYFVRLKKPHARIINEKLGKTFALDYSGETLPRFLFWNSAQSGDYALGLEPGTTEIDGNFAYRTIGKGETVQFSLRFEISDMK